MVRDEALIELGHPKYWDQYYASGMKNGPGDSQAVISSYEWLRNFGELHSFFINHLPEASSGCHILHLGCGSSVISTLLFDTFRVLHAED